MPLATTAWFMWIENERLKKLIIDWFKRSQGETVDEPDFFDKFMFLWVSFNAWTRTKSRKEKDREIIEFCKTEKGLSEQYQRLLDNEEFRRNVESLKSMCPIRRNKEYRGKREVRIIDVSSFGEVLEAIYTIRCNLFHGEKSPNDERDCALVELAFRILSRIFSVVIAKL